MKPDGSVLKNKIVIENYHLLSLDGSRKGGGVACFINTLSPRVIKPTFVLAQKVCLQRYIYQNHNHL